MVKPDFDSVILLVGEASKDVLPAQGSKASLRGVEYAAVKAAHSAAKGDYKAAMDCLYWAHVFYKMYFANLAASKAEGETTKLIAAHYVVYGVKSEVSSYLYYLYKNKFIELINDK